MRARTLAWNKVSLLERIPTWSAGRVQTLKAGGLDTPEAWWVACGAGKWLCWPASMPTSQGLGGGLGAQDSGPWGLAPSLVSQSCPLRHLVSVG